MNWRDHVVGVEVDEGRAEGDSETDRRIYGSDEVEEEDLNQKRRAAEEPDVHPSSTEVSSQFEDRRISATITPRTIPITIPRTVNSTRDQEPTQDAAVKQVVTDDPPLEAWVGRD